MALSWAPAAGLGDVGFVLLRLAPRRIRAGWAGIQQAPERPVHCRLYTWFSPRRRIEFSPRSSVKGVLVYRRSGAATACIDFGKEQAKLVITQRAYVITHCLSLVRRTAP